MNNHPTRFNEIHFSSEKFPEVIGFCDRNDSSRIFTASEESYEYALNGKVIYTLKKFASQWELVETENKKIIRVSTGRTLGMVLMQALRFSSIDKGKQEERVNILLPVKKADMEKTLAFMYYFGGYPGSTMEISPEFAIIIERFVDPNITFLSYSYVPAIYLEWLREELKKAEIIEEGANKTLWVYKK